MARFTLEKFEKFLKGVDLLGYRDRYSKIKTVEMDLPRQIQALQTIYEQYWDNIDNRDEPLSFDEYYKVYYETHQKDIEDFWHKSGFGTACDCFPKGLEARIYRTWASLITQIHGGYVAEEVFGKGLVNMSTELDHQNIDIQVMNPDDTERLRIQIKKVTHRPEIARMLGGEQNKNGTADIYYIVPAPKDYADPFYKKNGKGHKVGDMKPFTKSFIKWYPETGTLNRLDNGFVVFVPRAFLELEED